MMQLIDNQLNRITMYRLVLYYLIFLYAAAIYMSIENMLVVDPYALTFSLGLLLAVCWITNRVFAWVYKVPANVESVYISALILALIITPPQITNDYWFLIWAGVLSMASKYIVAYKGKHIFNPVAFAVTLTYFTINQSASWWIGSPLILPLVILGGLLVTRKIGRFDLIISFLLASLGFTLLSSLFTGLSFVTSLQNMVLYSPILFFSFIILTEPLTTPPTHRLRVNYGILVGFLFIPQLRIGSLFITPELAILIGNIYSFIVSPKDRLRLRLKDKNRIARDIYEFTFSSPRRFNFKPGQYMEWTLGHNEPDSRGNRRYFTLASSPTENVLRLGIRFYENPSTFKQSMGSMAPGSEIIASQLDGDFVLPDNPKQRCVLIAGGIGITPFRSMIKRLLDIHQHRPVTVFYAVKSVEDIVYKDIFDRAERDLGIKTYYSISNSRDRSSFQPNTVGIIDEALIKKIIPSYRTCLFFISGSRGMVTDFKSILRGIGVASSQIKTDFFAGLA